MSDTVVNIADNVFDKFLQSIEKYDHDNALNETDSDQFLIESYNFIVDNLPNDPVRQFRNNPTIDSKTVSKLRTACRIIYRGLGNVHNANTITPNLPDNLISIITSTLIVTRAELIAETHQLMIIERTLELWNYNIFCLCDFDIIHNDLLIAMFGVWLYLVTPVLAEKGKITNRSSKVGGVIIDL